jgi:SAM-dependent methyltransferase
MGLMQACYPESRFGGFTDIDGTIAFYNRVNALLDASAVVVDFGCGRGAGGEDSVPFRRKLRILHGKVRTVIGLDVDPAAGENPYIDTFHLLQGERWPLADDSADLCVADYALEHVWRPEAFFSECRRVLRRHGYVCIRTTNARSYPALVSRLTPERLRARVLAKAARGREDRDLFPTVYRCNTIGRIRDSLRRNDFEHVVYGFEPEPSYLSFSRLAYWMGRVHRRLAPSGIRPVIFAFGRLQKAA